MSCFGYFFSALNVKKLTQNSESPVYSDTALTGIEALTLPVMLSSTRTAIHEAEFLI